MISAADRASLRWSARSPDGDVDPYTAATLLSEGADAKEHHERVPAIGPSSGWASSAAGSWAPGIAEVAARAGVDVSVCDINDAAAAAGRARIETLAGPGSDAPASSTTPPPRRQLARIAFVTDLGELADRQLVIEAVREFEDEKLEVFRHLGKIVVDDEAILASNTSSIPIMKLAMATDRPEHVRRVCTSSTRCR